MTGVVCAAERQEAAGLAADFPGWHVWRSRGRRWWATRRGNWAARRDRPAEWTMTVDGDTPEELRAQLKLQDDLPDGTTGAR